MKFCPECKNENLIPLTDPMLNCVITYLCTNCKSKFLEDIEIIKNKSDFSYISQDELSEYLQKESIVTVKIKQNNKVNVLSGTNT